MSVVHRCLAFFVLAFVFTLGGGPVRADEPPARLKVLFLGDRGHHQPAARFKQLQPVLAARGIDLTYSENMDDLNPKTLADYRGLAIYSNETKISPEQEKAMLDFVAGGKGLIPLHCASYCFHNSPKYVELVGAQFQKHGTGVFRTEIAQPDNPVVRGFKGFESWDETYVHTRHNEKDRIVLEYRADAAGREPWTWIRTHEKGRVFYTAWGHDERTWSNPGFHNLVERGIRWAVGDDPALAGDFASAAPPEMIARRTDLKPLEFQPAVVPFYPPGEKWGTIREPIKQMQKPLDPAESARHAIHPKGFELKLYAAEPSFGQLGKPIAMNWDERGRLWLCVTTDYPNELQPQGKGRDQIVICEDTKGLSAADKFTVFAEGLSIPTAIVCYRGGAIVQNGIETIYLKDTDGDGKADLRKTLITGWGLGDTHGGVSNFRFGLDGWVYAMQGYNHSEPVLTGGKKVQPFSQGFFRFKVEGDGQKTAVTDMEFLRSTNNNTWGLGLSEEGLVFGSTANGNPSEFMSIPNRYYENVRGWSSTVLGGIADSNRFRAAPGAQVRQVDHHGGYTAAAGHALYTARAYPKEYWNRTSFVTEPTGHLVAVFQLRSDGSGFRSRNDWNLYASDDEWSAPIAAEVGPDGQVWILDWYNYIVQHNPTPAGYKTGKGNAYEIPLRDKTHGRIYRLTMPAPATRTTAVRDERIDLSKSTPQELVAMLRNDNMFWRIRAERLLLDRGQIDVASALVELVQDPSVDAIGLNPGAIHALWTLRELGLIAEKNPAALAAATAALSHKSAGVRRNAVAVLPHDEQTTAALIESKVLEDSNPQVRLAAILALADAPPSGAAAKALAALWSDPTVTSDRWLLDALTAASARHDSLVLAALAADRKAGSLNEPALQRAAIVAQHFARGAPQAEVASLLRGIAQAPLASPQLAAQIVSGLAAGWPKDKPAQFEGDGEDSLVKLLTVLPPEARGKLITLAGKLGSKKLAARSTEIAAAFLATAKDAAQTDPARLSAAREFIVFRKTDAAAAGELLAILSPRCSPELVHGLFEAAALSEAEATGPTLLAALDRSTPAARPIVLRALLLRADWTPALLAALEQGKVQVVELALDQRQALLAHPDTRLAARAKTVLEKTGGLVNADRQKVIDDWMPLLEKTGNVAAGKEVFKKTCAKCHMHSGEGAKIGPDLTGMNVHPKHELIIHVLDPSRSVEANFRVYTVQTEDGLVLSGLLASETKTTIELIDAEAKSHVVQRADIARFVPSQKSLMPEGFEKQVKPEEFTDLMEFLTQRGKFVPIPLDKAATIVSTKNIFFDREGIERMAFDDWKPKTFAGVPFVLVDPQGQKVKNCIELNGPNGEVAPRMPKKVTLPCNGPARTIHLLSGVSGWGAQAPGRRGVSMIVRLHYADGKTEDHELYDGEHFADYIGRFDVPKSQFAFDLGGRQLRYLSISPKRTDSIKEIELVKGSDRSAPLVMAVTVESP